MAKALLSGELWFLTAAELPHWRHCPAVCPLCRAAANPDSVDSTGERNTPSRMEECSNEAQIAGFY